MSLCSCCILFYLKKKINNLLTVYLDHFVLWTCGMKLLYFKVKPQGPASHEQASRSPHYSLILLPKSYPQPIDT